MKLVLTVAAVFAAASTLLAQSKANDEVLAAEKAWADSYQACNMAGMGRLLSDDMSMIQHNGVKATKEGFLKVMSSCSIEKVANDAQRVRVYGDTAAVEGTS